MTEETYHFKTIDGEDLKVKVGELRAIEHTTDELLRSVVILHLRTTGKEFPIDGKDKVMLRDIQTLVEHQSGHSIA